MELNPVLLAVLAVAIGITLYRSVILYPFKYNRGWVAVSVGVALLIGVMLLLNPEYAGVFGFAVWGLLVIIPSLSTRLALNLAARGQYRPALRLSQLARVLHPVDNLLSMPDLIRIQFYEHIGDIDAALRLLERYRNDPLRRIYAQTQIFRIKEQFPELLTWLERNVTADHYRRDPSLLQIYLRALGNVGKLNEMITMFIRYRSTLERVPDQLLYNYMVIFTACGKPDLIQQMFAGQYHMMPASVKTLWIGIAEIAAGNIEVGTQTLQQLTTSADHIARSGAERKLRLPAFVAQEILTPESQQSLAQIEREFAQFQRYQVSRAARATRLYVTFLLIAVNVLVWLLELQQGGDMDVVTLYRLGALYPPAIIQSGEWWRVIAAMFLHLGPLHLGMNMLALYILGRFTERTLGHLRQLIVYFAAGIGSMLVIIGLTQANILSQDVTVGASGAIMGLVGATAAIYIYDWRSDASRLARRGLFNALMIVALQAGLDILIPQTSFAGHLSGAMIGFLAALPLVALMRRRSASVQPKAG